MRALKLFGNSAPPRVHHRRPGAGVLPDRRAVLLPAARSVHHRTHPVRSQAAQGPRARRSLLRFDPRADPRLHARDRARAGQARRSVKTRHNEVAPNQYEVAPVFENSNVGRRPPAADDAGDAERGAPLRAGLPAAREALRRRQRHGQAQQLVDGDRHGENLLEPGDTPHENLEFLFFCAAVIQAVNKHQGLLRASIASPGKTTAWAPTRRLRRSSRSSSATELERRVRRDRAGRGGRAQAPQSFLGLGTPVLPPLPKHGGDRNRTSPFAFTGNKFEFRALGSSQSLVAPEHAC